MIPHRGSKLHYGIDIEVYENPAFEEKLDLSIFQTMSEARNVKWRALHNGKLSKLSVDGEAVFQKKVCDEVPIRKVREQEGEEAVRIREEEDSE
jgi:hypothetical protein